MLRESLAQLVKAQRSRPLGRVFEPQLSPNLFCDLPRRSNMTSMLPNFRCPPSVLSNNCWRDTLTVHFNAVMMHAICSFRIWHEAQVRRSRWAQIFGDN